MGCLETKPSFPLKGSKPLKQINIDYSSFVTYYKSIRKKLKANNFKFNSSSHNISLEKKIAAYNGLSKTVAKLWISLYLDYMVLAAWNLHSGTKMIIYPPYAIQQVARLHTTSTHNYIAFTSLITDGKGIIDHYPFKLISKQSADEYKQSLKDSYNYAKEFLKENLYENPAVHKTFKRRTQAEGVWEDFEITLMQCEFNFCFFDTQSREKFNQILSDNANDMALEVITPEEVMKVGDNLRKSLGVEELLHHTSQEEYRSLLQDCQIKSDNENNRIILNLNQISFSREFVNLLAWEQRISIKEALKWIQEYLKFLFLISVTYESSPQIILYPSESVQQVLHLHMQFVNKYEYDIDKLTLSKNSLLQDGIIAIESTEEYIKGYEQTLEIYKSYFGSPDERLWPLAEVRCTEIGKYASYYLFFARKCLTEEQKMKALQKYIEYKKNKKNEESEEEKDYTDAYYYNNYGGVGFDALILGMLLFSDPFSFTHDYDYVDPNIRDSEEDIDYTLDDQSVNNYTVDDIKNGEGLMYMENGNFAPAWGRDGNNNEDDDADDGDGDDGGDGGGDGGD